MKKARMSKLEQEVLGRIVVPPVRVNVSTRFTSSMNRHGDAFGDELVELSGKDRFAAAEKLKNLAAHLSGTWSDEAIELQIFCLIRKVRK